MPTRNFIKRCQINRYHGSRSTNPFADTASQVGKLNVVLPDICTMYLQISRFHREAASDG